MAEHEDPWITANPQLKGPWTDKLARQQKPCTYCGKPAIMNEPGTGRKAHKVCSQGTTSAPPVSEWDGEDRKPVADAPYGCGGATSPIVMGRVCGGSGEALACQLCPRSPNYWRRR